MGDREGMFLDTRGTAEGPEGVEEGENVIRIYFMRNNLSHTF